MKTIIIASMLFLGDSLKVDTTKVDTFMIQQQAYSIQQKAVETKIDTLFKKLNDPERLKKIKARIKK